jgi:hypothetical protein
MSVLFISVRSSTDADIITCPSDMARERGTLNSYSGSYVAQMALNGHNITFTRIYNNHGPVRVKLNTNKPMAKLPSVQQLINQLTKKHEKIRVSDVSGDKGTNNIRYGYIHKDLSDPELSENEPHPQYRDIDQRMTRLHHIDLTNSLTSCSDVRSPDDVLSRIRRPILHKEPPLLHREAPALQRETSLLLRESSLLQREQRSLHKEAPLTSATLLKDTDHKNQTSATKIKEIVEKISPRRYVSLEFLSLKYVLW